MDMNAVVEACNSICDRDQQDILSDTVYPRSWDCANAVTWRKLGKYRTFIIKALIVTESSTPKDYHAN